MAGINLKHIKKSFTVDSKKIDVLNDINLEIPENKITVLLGKSGCGKTTLLNILGLLDEPTDGEIYIGGEKIHYKNEKAKTAIRNQKIGFVFQFHYLLNEFTALENVMMPALVNKNMSRNEAYGAFRR